MQSTICNELAIELAMTKLIMGESDAALSILRNSPAGQSMAHLLADTFGTRVALSTIYPHEVIE